MIVTVDDEAALSQRMTRVYGDWCSAKTALLSMHPLLSSRASCERGHARYAPSTRASPLLALQAGFRPR